MDNTINYTYRVFRNHVVFGAEGVVLAVFRYSDKQDAITHTTFLNDDVGPAIRAYYLNEGLSVEDEPDLAGVVRQEIIDWRHSYDFNKMLVKDIVLPVYGRLLFALDYIPLVLPAYADEADAA